MTEKSREKQGKGLPVPAVANEIPSTDQSETVIQGMAS